MDFVQPQYDKHRMRYFYSVGNTRVFCSSIPWADMGGRHLVADATSGAHGFPERHILNVDFWEIGIQRNNNHIQAVLRPQTCFFMAATQLFGLAKLI